MREKLDRWEWAYALVATTVGLGSWSMFLRGFLRASIVAVHRPAGDIQYLPLVGGLAQFELGDHQVWEARGSGVCSFPVAALLPHALGVRLLGAAGMALVDALIGGAYFLVGRWLLLRVGLDRRWASWLSLMSLLLCFAGTLAPLYQLGLPLGLFPNESLVWPLSPFRFPRPYVTELFVLLAVASLLRFVTAQRLRDGDALLGAVSAAAVLQADIYSATAVLPLLLAAAGGRLVLDAADGRTGRRRLLLFGVALAVLVLPFVLQRLFEHPDVPRRFGLRPARLEDYPLGKLEMDRLRVTLVGTAAVLAPLAIGRIRRRRAARCALAALATLFLVTASASLARTVFVFGTGKIAQPYHFELLHDRFFGIALLATAAAFVELAVRKATRLFERPWRFRLELAGLLLGAVLVLSVTWRHLENAWRTSLPHYHVRSDFFHYRELGPAYLRDLRAITRELRQREGLRVIATLDHELAVWWVTFGDGALLNPDPFATPLPDEEIERRLVALGALLGLSSREFVQLLTQRNDPARNNKLGHNNIVTNLFYSHARFGVRHSWYLYLTPAEQRRLKRLYEARGPVDYRVDAVVLFAHGSLSHLKPDPTRFELAFKNTTFRLYVAR